MCCSGSGAIRARAEPPSRYLCACAHRPALQHRARTHAHSRATHRRCAARRRSRAPSRRARALPPLTRAHGVRECPRPFVLREADGRVYRSHGVLRRRVLPGCSVGASPSAHADEACVAWLPGRSTFVCSASTARGTEVRHVASEGSRVRALAARPLRLAALHVRIGRFYAGCMVFPPRASCAAPGVVDDFDPMEGSCKIRRFRRGCSTSAPGLALGCAHVCDAAGLCASV
jgi:hypothetical protein